MTMPIDVWKTVIVGAAITSGILLYVNDGRNYTDVISGLLSTILWFVAGSAINVGILTADGLVWNSGSLFWVCIGIAAVIGLITFVKMIDAANKTTDHVNMHFDTRL
jgi:hypothetical protein